MAKKHSRKQRKIEKEKALQRLARQAGVKHYNTLSQADLQRIAQKQANAQVNRRREAEKRKSQREATRRKKVKYLEEIGLNPFN